MKAKCSQVINRRSKQRISSIILDCQQVQDESCRLLLEYSISVTLDKIKDATAYKWYSKAYRTLAAISPSGVINQKHLNTLSGNVKLHSLLV